MQLGGAGRVFSKRRVRPPWSCAAADDELAFQTQRKKGVKARTLNISNDINSLTNFKRQTAKYLRQLHDTGSPLVLTVNGKAEVVVQDAAAYQRLVELAAQADQEETVAAIRAALADAEAGRVKPARPALQVLAKKYGIRTTES